MIVDIVIGNSLGDEAKGKVIHHLLKTEQYTHVIRFNGSNNAGHTIFHNGKKIITHLIPSGVFFGIKSIIGPGCVLNVKSFFEEIFYLKNNGIDCENIIKIADTVHIITDKHLEEDSHDVKIGTTKRGVGQAYRDKYARVGIQAKSIPELKPYLIDFYEEIFHSSIEPKMIFEGAQGFYLDPHYGDYPYVTSSHPTVAGVLLNGIPHTAIRNVYGVIKGYDTYVGAKKFQPEGEIFNQLQEIGNEYGATTKRARQCNFLNINNLEKAININAPNHLIVNKMDILAQLNCYKIIKDGSVLDLKTEENFIQYLRDRFSEIEIKFSYSPERI